MCYSVNCFTNTNGGFVKQLRRAKKLHRFDDAVEDAEKFLEQKDVPAYVDIYREGGKKVCRIANF